MLSHTDRVRRTAILHARSNRCENLDRQVRELEECCDSLASQLASRIWCWSGMCRACLKMPPSLSRSSVSTSPGSLSAETTGIT